MKTLLIISLALFASLGFSAEPITDTEVESAAIVEYLNTADTAELETVKGIGPVIAERIIAARPFTEPQQVYLVKGIGETIAARLFIQAIAE